MSVWGCRSPAHSVPEPFYPAIGSRRWRRRLLLTHLRRLRLTHPGAVGSLRRGRSSRGGNDVLDAARMDLPAPRTRGPEVPRRVASVLLLEWWVTALHDEH
jgi:hypothetical protein